VSACRAAPARKIAGLPTGGAGPASRYSAIKSIFQREAMYLPFEFACYKSACKRKGHRPCNSRPIGRPRRSVERRGAALLMSQERQFLVRHSDREANAR